MTNFITQNDQHVFNLLQSDDTSAFKELYERYWEKLYSIALARLNNSFEAEEVVQSIYTMLWNNRRGLNTETEFDRYLYGAVKVEVINRLAKRTPSLERVDKLRQDMHSGDDLLDEVDRTVKILPHKCRTRFTLAGGAFHLSVRK